MKKSSITKDGGSRNHFDQHNAPVMRSILFGRAVIAHLALAACLTQAAQTPGERERLDAAINRALQDKRIVGTVVIVVRNGKTVYQRAAGLSDRETKQPMKVDDVFRLASMSKQITSVATLALVDKGMLSLDDPVSKWIPTFKPKTKDGNTPVITVRHLLTHTSGLSYSYAEPAGGPYDKANVSDGLDQPGLSMEENLRRIASVPLSFEPGSAWAYSVSIDVLGEVLSRAAGKPLPKVIEEHVTKPLGMNDTGFSLQGKGKVTAQYVNGPLGPLRMVDGHLVSYGPGRGVLFSPSRYSVAGSFASGGAGILGTAADFVKLLEALRKGGRPILKPETASQTTSNQVGGLMGSTWAFGYGVGILLNPEAAKSPMSAGSYRWGGIYGHSWFVDPKEQLTVVIMTNTATEGLNGQFPKWIRDAVYGIPLPPRPGTEMCER